MKQRVSSITQVEMLVPSRDITNGSDASRSTSTTAGNMILGNYTGTESSLDVFSLSSTTTDQPETTTSTESSTVSESSNVSGNSITGDYDNAASSTDSSTSTTTTTDLTETLIVTASGTTSDSATASGAPQRSRSKSVLNRD